MFQRARRFRGHDSRHDARGISRCESTLVRRTLSRMCRSTRRSWLRCVLASAGCAALASAALSLGGCAMVVDNVMNPDDPGLDLPRDKTRQEQLTAEQRQRENAARDQGIKPEDVEEFLWQEPTLGRMDGTNRRIVLRAPDDGDLHVTTNDDETTVYRKRLANGDLIVVDVPRNRLTINARRVNHVQLRKRQNYRVWFRTSSLSFSKPQWDGHQR